MAGATAPTGEPSILGIVRNVGAYNPGSNLNLIRRAYVFAEQAHRDQRRRSGEAYVGHPVAVADILTTMKMDDASICAALLHDTVEDTPVTLEDVEQIFSKEIADLVDGVTKLSKIRFRSKEERQAENFRKMLIAMSRDIRVILVKLADRTHNMRTLASLPVDKQIGIARETMDIFAPLANRLGLGSVKIDLEDLSFRYLYPEEYQDLSRKVSARLEERRDFVARVIEEIRGILAAEGLEAEVTGRPKHFWSIHRKMLAQRIPFENVYDHIAFRVIVQRQADCYHALGLVHERWPPVPGRFKDYIALPKPNQYQSLHTAVIGPEGQRIEVQIRTEAMHRVAEGGIAAHWRYKEGGRQLQERDEERFGWLKGLMEWQQELDDPSEFLESVKLELFAEDVYTFTPAGELKVLQRGSTPVDFAYQIHSEVGNTCSGALVNGAMVPLSHELHNGDVVEIITNRKQRPSKDWLKFVKTNRAQARIRAFIKREQRARSLELGEQLLEKEFRRYSKSLARLRKTEEFRKAATALNLEGVDEVIVQVGTGKLTPESVVSCVLPEDVTRRAKPAEPTAAASPIARFLRRMTGGPSGVVVDGLDGVSHSIAKCCGPVPGEPIVGYVTQGHVVSVHRRGCVNTVDLPAARQVEVRWGGSLSIYPVSIRVLTETGVPGLLTRMTKIFSDLKINIDMANCSEVETGRAENIFRFHAKHLDELNTVVRKLRALDGVYGVERVRDLGS